MRRKNLVFVQIQSVFCQFHNLQRKRRLWGDPALFPGLLPLLHQDVSTLSNKRGVEFEILDNCVFVCLKPRSAETNVPISMRFFNKLKTLQLVFAVKKSVIIWLQLSSGHLLPDFL